jgi:hypothetical protein
VLVERRESVPTARLRTVAGRVEGKPAPIPWSPAREQDLMLEEDGLRTGNRASTEMEFQDGTRVLMTEDSVVYLRRRGHRLTGVPPRSVEIVEGQAEVAARQPEGSDRAVEILVGGARAVSRPDEAGVAQTRARRAEDDTARVMVYEGGTDVESGGQMVAVARGMGTSVAPGKPPAPPEELLPPPGGLKPQPGARLTFNDIRFTWRAVAGAASYTAELCRDSDCAFLLERRTGLADAMWRPQPPPLGEYFWRVTAVSASGLDGYPSAGAGLSVRGGPDRTGPTGGLTVVGRQIRLGDRLVVDETVRVEPVLEDAQSGIAGWRPVIDDDEVSLERWGGPWPDGTFRVAVRATDEAGNESLIAASEEIVVDALPPEIAVSGQSEVATGPGVVGSWRCGWLERSTWRWASSGQCDWLRRARRRWLKRGWNWLEVSVDGQQWNPLLAAGSEPAQEVAGAGYQLPPAPTSVVVEGDDAQLLVRAADGSTLLPQEGATAAAGLRIRAQDAGCGVDRMELRVDEPEPGVLTLRVQASDAFGHRRELVWQPLRKAG